MTAMTPEQVDFNTVYLPETGGVFFGCTVEEVEAAIAKVAPNYQTHNLSYTFSDVYFNYCIRKELLK